MIPKFSSMCLFPLCTLQLLKISSPYVAMETGAWSTAELTNVQVLTHYDGFNILQIRFIWLNTDFFLLYLEILQNYANVY